MKVLHVNEHLAHRGGVETYLFGLLPRLEKRGITPVVAYGGGDPALHEPVRHIPALGTAGFRAEARVRTQMEGILREETPDIVHVHNVQNVGALQASLDFVPDCRDDAQLPMGLSGQQLFPRTSPSGLRADLRARVLHDDNREALCDPTSQVCGLLLSPDEVEHRTRRPIRAGHCAERGAEKSMKHRASRRQTCLSCLATGQF
jgi:hypothetical protein